MSDPETRPSLLLRIRDSDDRDAWHEFAKIYRPVIIRVARAKGLQDADAEDLAQRVLLSVAGAIQRFDPEGDARFRTWLRRITENAIINAVRQGRRDRGIGGDAVLPDILNHCSIHRPDSELIRIEYRREVFAWAARQARNHFSEATWQSFWLTAVEGEDVDAVAEKLNRTRGSIYASRSRVMKQLVQMICQLEGESDEV